MNAAKTLVVQGWDVVVARDEPRVLDLDVAKAAGLRDPQDVRRIIARNRDELEAHGTLEVSGYRPETPAGGRPGLRYLLNEAQALALVALMRTRKARELRIGLVRLFVAVRRGHVPAPVVALPIAEVHGSRIGETITRAELVAWCRLASATLEVTLHRVHGALRRQYKVASPYHLSLSVWPTARAFLEALATQRLFLDAPRRAAPLRLLQGGAQLSMPWGRR